MIGRIRLMLSFQAECAIFLVLGAAFADDGLVQMDGRIELHPWFCGPHRPLTSACRFFYFGYLSQRSRFAVEHGVVVVPADILDLGNARANGRWFTEV